VLLLLLQMYTLKPCGLGRVDPCWLTDWFIRATMAPVPVEVVPIANYIAEWPDVGATVDCKEGPCLLAQVVFKGPKYALVDGDHDNWLTTEHNSRLGFYLVTEAGEVYTDAYCPEIRNGWCFAYRKGWRHFVNGKEAPPEAHYESRVGVEVGKPCGSLVQGLEVQTPTNKAITKDVPLHDFVGDDPRGLPLMSAPHFESSCMETDSCNPWPAPTYNHGWHRSTVVGGGVPGDDPWPGPYDGGPSNLLTSDGAGEVKTYEVDGRGFVITQKGEVDPHQPGGLVGDGPIGGEKVTVIVPGGKVEPPKFVLLPRGCNIFGDPMQDGSTVVCDAPVDPVDVPAIKRELATQILMEGIMVSTPCEGRWVKAINKAQVCYEKRWTCRNPADVLLTSEDGHHWCHEVRPLLPANGKKVNN
jgi:hypothetical protein